MTDLFRGESLQDWPDDYREQFWQEYPRRIGKGAALKKLDNIRKTKTVRWQELVESIRRYSAWLSDKGSWRPEPKHPTTWLNQECWNDELPNGKQSFDDGIRQLAEQARDLERQAGFGRPPHGIRGD